MSGSLLLAGVGPVMMVMATVAAFFSRPAIGDVVAGCPTGSLQIGEK